jgi:c-di-GMP-binding flagellar brake protein YcgR
MIDANIFLEKRAYPRISVKIPVKYRLIEDQHEVKDIAERRKSEQNAQTMDISLGGMYIVADHSLSVGALLRIEFKIRGSARQLMAMAEVAWSNETGAGLRFLSMKEEDAEDLKRCLDEAANRFGPASEKQ